MMIWSEEFLAVVYRLLRYSLDVSMHLLSSALVGLVVFYLTWITSWFLFGVIYEKEDRHWTRMTWSLTCKAGRYIGQLSWSAALFAVFLLHVLQDFYTKFW